MQYVVGMVDDEIDRLPDGRICGMFEDTYSSSYETALEIARILEDKHPEREIVICRESDLFNRDDESPELLVMWSSRDMDFLKNGYLAKTTEQYKGAISISDIIPFPAKSDKPSIYFDIDGTLGKWYADSRGYESLSQILNPYFHYFLDIEEHKYMIELARQMQDQGFDVCIVSAADRDTIRDKAKWVDQNLPFIPKENVFFAPLGADKTHFVKGNAEISVLIDDYNKNLNQWKGHAIKAINTVNSHQEKYPEIDMTVPEEIMEMIQEWEPQVQSPDRLKGLKEELRQHFADSIKTVKAEMQTIEKEYHLKPEKSNEKEQR